ncbi:TLD domain-containing protein KIAA1609 [Seminavis robusta]|uniref:Oxidation resistance protein 1 n=1 Tax=Seminavis robusta TaxID=568900 RepID=A0A9N8EAW3_9STRA|nr:TLD domain-containing protein KIAA1609 [Seminavis robusta]|eukprot:Sro858_g211810.1 TLD domain-containing protein KIAA1609 (579) ;mRNA; r:14999-16735
MTSTATTTTSNDDDDLSAYKEKFLDKFPLTETEVDRLLLLFPLTTNDETNDSVKIVHHNNNTHQDDDDEWHATTLRQIQESILPKARQWLFVEAPNLACPLLPYDIPDDKEKSALCSAFYFLEAMVSMMGRRGSRFLINFVYTVASNGQNSTTNGGGPTPEALVDILYRHLMAALQITTTIHKQQQNIVTDPPKAWIRSLSKTAGSSVSRSAWTEWINNVLPQSIRGLSTFYYHVLFPNSGTSSSSTSRGPNSLPPLSLPQTDQDSFFWRGSSSSSSSSYNNNIPLTLTCMAPSLSSGNKWYRLYSSNWDGLSFLALQNALLSYTGATVMLVRPKKEGHNNNTTTPSSVFGFYTDSPWKESNSWFGGEGFDSFLFYINDNDLGVYWPTWETSNGHYMYLNASPQNSGIQQQATALRGLAMGGISADTPRVHLTPSLENCKATVTDTTYASGALLPDDPDGMPSSPFFDVDALEVWAIASKEEYLQHRAAGTKQLARKEETRQRAAQVDRSQFLNDFQTGAFINNLFDHREEARGRHDFVAADSGSGYFVEEKPPSISALSPEKEAKSPLGQGDGEETQ